MNIHINPQLFKNAKSVNKLKNGEIAELLGISKSTVDDITRKQSFNSEKLQALCQCLDVSPNYLIGSEKEKPEEIYTDILTLKKSVFKKKYPINDEEYNSCLAFAKRRIDPEGLYMRTYSEYLSTVSVYTSFEKFRKWLMSINLNDFIMFERLEFPTNAELAEILPPDGSMELYEFWEHMVDSAYQYLVSHNLYKPPFGDNPTEEEKDIRYAIKLDDCEKVKLEEI